MSNKAKLQKYALLTKDFIMSSLKILVLLNQISDSHDVSTYCPRAAPEAFCGLTFQSQAQLDRKSYWGFSNGCDDSSFHLRP